METVSLRAHQHLSAAGQASENREPTPTGFAAGLLGTMAAVGAISPRSAVIWLRSDRCGQCTIRCWPESQAPDGPGTRTAYAAASDEAADATAAVRLESLLPLTRYRFQVAGPGGNLISQGAFETAPARPADAPGRFSFGLMSCHQPFDARGNVRQPAAEMLEAARRCLHDRDAKFLLLVGDQVYSDNPECRSLFDPSYAERLLPAGRQSILDCTAAEVRRIYQDRYRAFWNIPGWQRLQAEFPCYPMLDDHEIVDNWGSRDEHLEEPWQALGKGALQAFADYQAARVFGPGPRDRSSFQYAFTYGPIGVFVMDLRSERRAGPDGQLFGPGQLAALEEFLARHRELAALFIVFTVPVIHLPRALVKLLRRLPAAPEDFADRWSALPHVRDRDRMLLLLRDHQRRNPGQRIVLLSGDIHIGCAHRIHWTDSAVPPIHQFVSSPITHETGLALQWASKLLMKANRRIETADGSLAARIRFLRGEGQRENPYGGLNLGIVEVEAGPSGDRPLVRLMLWGHRGLEPVCVYRSPPL